MKILLTSSNLIILFHAGNVAYGKTANQSGTYKDKIAPRAVDGNITADLAGGRCAHPDNVKGKPAWWSVDLGDLFKISDIVFFARNHHYRGYTLEN